MNLQTQPIHLIRFFLQRFVLCDAQKNTRTVLEHPEIDLLEWCFFFVPNFHFVYPIASRRRSPVIEAAIKNGLELLFRINQRLATDAGKQQGYHREKLPQRPSIEHNHHIEYIVVNQTRPSYPNARVAQGRKVGMVLYCLPRQSPAPRSPRPRSRWKSGLPTGRLFPSETAR